MKLYKNSLLPTLIFILFTQMVSPFGARADDAVRPEKVVLQLAWTHQFQFAGYYAALAREFYRDANLDVKVEEGVCNAFSA